MFLAYKFMNHEQLKLTDPPFGRFSKALAFAEVSTKMKIEPPNFTEFKTWYNGLSEDLKKKLEQTHDTDFFSRDLEVKKP